MQPIVNELLVPRMKPVARYTWEIREGLLNTQEASPRIPLTLPGPSIVIGIRAIARPNQAPAGVLIQPTNEDIVALIDLDNSLRFTSATGIATAAGVDSAFVTMSALDTQYRDLYWDLDAAKPTLGVTFRWRGTSALFLSAMCSIAFMVIPKTE